MKLMGKDKIQIRAASKIRRLSMDSATVERLSEQIVSRLVDFIEWTRIETIHTYKPIKKYREVDTNRLLKIILSEHPSARVAGWKGQAGLYESWWRNYNGWSKPVKNNFQFDVIIVPLLAFNMLNHRIGYGGGFYDRFLSNQKKATTIGLCYEADLHEYFEEDHDVKLDTIITERNIYN